MSLRVLVYGSGFAGQGHAQAFRTAGCDIVGMVGRTLHVVQDVAGKLNIPYAGNDWEEALDTLKPDIVAIGTPGGAHYEPIMQAFARGCHVFCDKPLAETAVHARELHDAGQKAGVKTAYAASYRYMPYVLLAKEMVADGKIGEPREVECVSHFNLNPLIPFGWSHRIDQGGGRLNNNFPHKLSIATHVLGAEITAVSGTIRNDMAVAPVVSGVHDFRTRRNFAPKSADEPGLEWAAADVEWSYTVLAKLDSPQAERPVSALFQHSGLQPRFESDYIAFYGEKGGIYIKGHYGAGPLYFYDRTQEQPEWEAVDLPARLTDSQPAIDDDTLRNWTILAQLFANDIAGMPTEGYQTFADGALYQEIIDTVRTDQNWTTIASFNNGAD